MPLIHRKYTVLSGNFMFDLHDFDVCNMLKEHKPGIK